MNVLAGAIRAALDGQTTLSAEVTQALLQANARTMPLPRRDLTERQRDILALLRAGELPVTELADQLGLTQPGASKHLRVLREVGLVRDRKAGKQRLYALDARGLRPIHEWTGGFEQFWNASFDRLDAYVQDLKRQEKQ